MGMTPRDRAEVIAAVEPLAIEHARAGGFWGTLPAYVYEKTGKKLGSEWFLNKVADEVSEFAQTKKLCFSLCELYWDRQVAAGEVQPAVWIFIKKNIAGWRDRIEHAGEGDKPVKISLAYNLPDGDKAKLEGGA
jgi:hypothetical protein